MTKSDGEYRILLTLVTEEVEEEEDCTVTYLHTLCELLVKEFGAGWGPCYKVRRTPINWQERGEYIRETDWYRSTEVIFGAWTSLAGHECPMQAEEIARVGKVAV
jgi:hypothetical protein